MSPLEKTSDEIVAQRMEDKKNIRITLQNMRLLASGAFSNVYRGTASTESNRELDIVIKKTWPKNRGTTMEVKVHKILDKIRHKNIARLLYTYKTKHEDRTCLSLIFEYVPGTLRDFQKHENRQIGIMDVKLITWQLFRGQAHLQKSAICHRDIKPRNLLFNPATGQLKISDFGSSCFQSDNELSSYHVTRYYRAPELCLGAKKYGCELDVWSCGCVMGELLKGGKLLAGKTPNNQAEVIFDVIGVPSKEELVSMRVSSSKYKAIFEGYRADPIKSIVPFSFLYEQTARNRERRRSTVYNQKIDTNDMKESADILRQILVYRPGSRLSGMELLNHPFFSPLFEPGATRSNNVPISCVTKSDWSHVVSGDTSTHETIE